MLISCWDDLHSSLGSLAWDPSWWPLLPQRAECGRSEHRRRPQPSSYRVRLLPASRFVRRPWGRLRGYGTRIRWPDLAWDPSWPLLPQRVECGPPEHRRGPQLSWLPWTPYASYVWLRSVCFPDYIPQEIRIPKSAFHIVAIFLCSSWEIPILKDMKGGQNLKHCINLISHFNIG